MLGEVLFRCSNLSWTCITYTRTNHSSDLCTIAQNCCNSLFKREDERVHPIDAQCRTDNSSDSKENSQLTSEIPRTSREDVVVQPRGGALHTECNFYCAFHSLYLRNWAGNQSQLRILCSPIPALQNGIGFMLLRWSHKKCPDVNHTPVR